MANPDLVIDNLRLKELVIIVRRNEAFFREFESFLISKGFDDVAAFVATEDDSRAIRTITQYFANDFSAPLLDGIGRPFEQRKAKWYFMAWLFRDAPAQRLAPLLSSIQGRTPVEKQIILLNSIRKFVAPLFVAESWKWPAVSEVMLARLEGSRRSLKGGLFENIVRRSLTELFIAKKLPLTISEKEVRLHDETYDITVTGTKGKILIPVKTRETMGGGHALLFTRDIHKSISVAESDGFMCIPIVIAESWGGDLATLACKHFVYIQINPNQIERVEPLLAAEFRKLLDVFQSLV